MTYLKEKFIPVKNPYIVGDPIKDSKMFFGREQDFLNLRQLIEGGGAHVQLLIAGRRSGKTSLLLEIQRGRLKEIAEAVFVDFHELVPQLRQNEDFPKLIGEAILRNSAFSVFTEEFRQRGNNNWTTQLIFLVDRCLEVIKPRKLLLLCDEFESIEDCFNQQRLNSEALLWTRPILDKSVFFILTGSRNFESKIVSTALSNLSQIIDIQALAKKDAERLICIPVFGELDYDEEVVSRILRLSGNQPFYIQFLCNTLVNQNNAVYQHSKLVPEDLEDTLKYIFKNPHNHIEDTWKNPLGHHRLGNVEQLTQAHHFLATLANTLKSPDEYADAESILATATDRDFTVSKETIRTTVGWLKQKNSPLLETHIEKDCYRFQIDLLRRWIAYRFRFGEDVEVYRESQQEEESTIHTSTAGGTDKQQVQAYLEQLQELLREEDTITLTERQLLDKSVTDLKISPQQAVQLENQVRAQLRLSELDWRAEYKESCRVLQRQYSRHRVPTRRMLELKATYEDRQRLSPFEAKEIRQYLRVEKKGPSVAWWIGIIVGLLLLLVIVAGVWWSKQLSITTQGTTSTPQPVKIDKPSGETLPESTTTTKPVEGPKPPPPTTEEPVKPETPKTPIDSGQRKGEGTPVKPKVTSIQGYDYLVVDLDVADTACELDGKREHVRTRETNLGNLVSDILKETYQADVAVFNGGAIRDSIVQGPVMVGDIFKVLPFANTAYVLEMSGQDLLAMLEHSSKQGELGGEGGFLQVAGLSFKWEKGVGSRDVKVNEKPLDPNATYKVATSSFVADGGDGYTMLAKLPKEKRHEHYSSVNQTVLDYLGNHYGKEKKPISSPYCENGAPAKAKRIIIEE